jgi:Ni/Co efflux regulator RcnB
MKRLAGALTLTLIFAGSLATAAPRFGGDPERAQSSQHRTWQQDGRSDRSNGREEGHRAFPREEQRPAREPERGYESRPAPRGFGHGWERGERLPTAYYARPYIIEDFRSCGLYAPPYGYRWVRVDGDAVLAAVATGIVVLAPPGVAQSIEFACSAVARHRSRTDLMRLPSGIYANRIRAVQVGAIPSITGSGGETICWVMGARVAPDCCCAACGTCRHASCDTAAAVRCLWTLPLCAEAVRLRTSGDGLVRGAAVGDDRRTNRRSPSE